MLKVTCEHKKEKSSDLMLIIVCATMFARPVKRRWCTCKNAFSTAVIVRLMCAYMRCNSPPGSWLFVVVSILHGYLGFESS